MDKCWYCTFPNDIPVLFHHPYFIIIDMPTQIVCVYRMHGEVSGCRPCVMNKMKDTFKVIAERQGLKPDIKESWDSGHLHYTIDKSGKM